MIFLLGHSKENNYDGYAPHHHAMLLRMEPEEYLQMNAESGVVFPGPAYAEKIMNPWLYWFIRKLCACCGYNFREQVEPAHRNLYAFPGLHDGVDIYPTISAPGGKFAEVQSTYKNANGYRATASVFALNADDVLVDFPLQQAGEVWVQLRDAFHCGVSINGSSYVKCRDLGAILGAPVWDDLHKTVMFRTL